MSFLLPLAAARTAAAAVEAPPQPRPLVWEVRMEGTEESHYARALERSLPQWETETGRKLVPGTRGKVALKVYSGGGAGIATPRALVRAVVHWLEGRGFARKDVFLIDLYENRLRDSGLLPPLATRDDTFDGLEVRVLESGRWYDGNWFHDSPLPARVDTFGEGVAQVERTTPVAERRSLLAAPLLFDVDFWINLPTLSDHPAFGVNAALANATLWNASNTLRFFRSRTSAPGAIAEMAAIPELRTTWAVTILSLERYQYIGGPGFNSFYTTGEPVVWISEDPVLLDALGREKLDVLRTQGGFAPLTAELPLLKLAEALKIGTADTARALWRRDS